MNVKNKIHTARFKELNKEQDQFINARITTPQTYDEIKKKGHATILKIASKGIVEKLLKRCELYKRIINKKTETIKSKNELINLLSQRLIHHEPELFKADFKDIKEQVDQAEKEEVKTGLENESKEELTKEEKEQTKKDNEEAEKENQEDESQPDPEKPDREPGITKCDNCGEEYEDDRDHECRDIDDGENRGSECGEGGDEPDIDDLGDDPDTDDKEKENEEKDN